MSRVSIGLGVALFSAMAMLILGPVSLAQPPRGEAADHPFTGQFMTIVKKSNQSSSIDLEKVRIQKLDGRSFLVGTGCDTPDNWQKGKMVWVALDDVSEVTVFATLEELRKAGTLQDAPKAENPPKRDGLGK
jgi:hypothetical protein